MAVLLLWIICIISVLCSDLGVASWIPARSHTFVEIDHEIISTVILLPSAESFKKGCCQLQAIVCARSTCNCLVKLAQEKVWLGTDLPAMTIAVDLGRKATKQTKTVLCLLCLRARLFIDALWSAAGKRAGLLALVCVVLVCVCQFPMWYPGSDVVLYCINS